MKNMCLYRSYDADGEPRPKTMMYGDRFFEAHPEQREQFGKGHFSPALAFAMLLWYQSHSSEHTYWIEEAHDANS